MQDNQPAGEPGAPAQAPPRRGRLRGLMRWVQRIVNVLAVVFVLAVFTPAGTWAGRLLVHVDPVADADHIVVLGGDVLRMVEAARLYRTGRARRVIITSNPDGAAEFAKVARLCGVPDDAIVLDDHSPRTAAHPRTVAALPGVDRENDRFLIVTGAFHTSRARACFVHAGFRRLCMRAPVWRIERAEPEGWCTRLVELEPKVYEAAAWAYYKLRGWL